MCDGDGGSFSFSMSFALLSISVAEFHAIHDFTPLKTQRKILEGLRLFCNSKKAINDRQQLSLCVLSIKRKQKRPSFLEFLVKGDYSVKNS